MDGRDIGTVVFPDAELKVFLTASPEIRAQRRMDELLQKGEQVSFEDVLANVKERDFRDQNRKISPLKKAEDAVLIDNSLMTLREQQKVIMELFEQRVAAL
jgi:cytidylate kinase